ncbi:cyclase family protein [Defluviitalea phaphyphila]|uniref:cyclase family protein n=1 Tax=Defluviitalea phaphyphila TaxID=1473580 RepID=UPI00073016DA|nr:cyclase family protein [Defluviitalea phaphyphila]
MKIIDLTHTISEDMSVYPGTEQPKLKTINIYEQQGFKETLINIFSHTGTHMDAPAHLYADKKTLDKFHISQFVGTAFMIDCTDLCDDNMITMKYINQDIKKADKAEFLIFRTGWGKYWGTDQYYGDYPCLDKEVVEYIIHTHKKGIGFDTISVDPIIDENFTAHKKLLAENEIVIIENLANLNEIKTDLFTLFALPLKYENSDGAPIRAIALIK